MREDDVHDPMFTHPEDWPVDLRIAVIVVLCISAVIAAAYFFVRFVGT